MAVYYVTPYFLKADKAGPYRKLIESSKFKKLLKDLEKETGIKYIGTFFPVFGFGEYDAEDWWEMKDYGGFDRFRASKVSESLFGETMPFVDTTRGVPARLYRSASDVKIYEPATKKEK